MHETQAAHGPTLRIEAPREPVPAEVVLALLFNDLTATNQRNEIVYHAELVGFTKMRDYRMPPHLRLLTALTRIPGLGKLLAPRRSR